MKQNTNDHFEVLRKIKSKPETSQRKLASALGFSLGKLNYLLKALQNIIKEAIKKGGSSIKDYASPQDDLGYFQTQFQVYDREGLPCYYCKSLITRIKQGGRSTFFCIKCQN